MDEDSIDDEIFIESIKQLRREVEAGIGVRSCRKLVVDLADGGLARADLDVLTEGLSKIKGVISAEFYLFNCKLADESLNNILEMLISKNKDTLEEIKLELTENSLGANSLLGIFEASNSVPNLKKINIDLSGNSLSKGSFTSSPIKLKLSQLKFLKLSLEETNLPGNLAEQLLDELLRQPSIKTLVINLTSCSYGFNDECVDALLKGSFSNLDLTFARADYLQVRSLILGLPRMANRFNKMKLDLSSTFKLPADDFIDWSTVVIDTYKAKSGNKMDIEETTNESQTGGLASSKEQMPDTEGIEDDLEAMMMNDPEYREMVASFKQKSAVKKSTDKTVLLKECFIDGQAMKIARKLGDCLNVNIVV